MENKDKKKHIIRQRRKRYKRQVTRRKSTYFYCSEIQSPKPSILDRKMDDSSISSTLDLDHLKALKVLGKGATGTVFLIQHNNTNKSSTLALKVIDKSTTHDALRRARSEIQLLSRFSHPFLPSLLATVESDHLLGWALPYCPGGDLNLLRHRQLDRVFSPAVIRFYLAEILCALDHLHSIGIAYRDLKPENVLIQQTGHVTLTDFDLSRNLKQKTVIPFPDSKPKPRPRPRPDNVLIQQISPVILSDFNKTVISFPDSKKPRPRPKPARVSPESRRKPSFSNGERSNSFVGTEEYVAPEVIRGDGHEFSVDWWALGVMSYEMFYGTTPFKGKNRKETFRNVLTKEPVFVGRKTALTDLIGKLLVKDPTKRLGYARGASEIKEHEFFTGVQWELLTEVVRPPFIPSRDDDDVVAEPFDVREYFHRLKYPPQPPPLSPLSSPSTEFQRNVSFVEF